MSEKRDAGTDSAEVRAELLKERVYLTFTALAVVLALRTHDEPARAAARSLLIVVIGTLLAVFLADVISHIAVHEKLPVKQELRHMLRVSFGAMSAVALPLIFVALAALGVWSIEPALRAATIALVASLVVIGYAAARRARLPVWQRLVVLFAEFGLSIAVVGLEVLAHG